MGKHYIDGIGVESDVNKAIKVYEKASEMGNDYGLYLIGNLYMIGDEVEQDMKKAMSYFLKSGNGEAFYTLATLYEEGKMGVEKNLKKALILFDKAAQKGLKNKITKQKNNFENL